MRLSISGEGLPQFSSCALPDDVQLVTTAFSREQKNRFGQQQPMP